MENKCKCFGNPGTNCFTGNCSVCGLRREQGNISLNDFNMEVLKDTRTPIYKGCRNKNGCFCSGECKIIIGYEQC